MFWVPTVFAIAREFPGPWAAATITIISAAGKMDLQGKEVWLGGRLELDRYVERRNAMARTETTIPEKEEIIVSLKK